MENTTLDSIDVPTLISQINSSLETVFPQANGLGDTLPSEKGDDHWNAIIEKVLDLRNLEDDWDGLGAKAPSAALLDSALQLAELFRQGGMKSPSGVVPGLDGEVIFDWQSKEVYQEVEVCKPSYAEYMKIASGQPSVHRVLTY